MNLCLWLLLVAATEMSASAQHLPLPDDSTNSDSSTPAAPTFVRPSVLLIFIDDLSPALGCYGDSRAKTPQIDRFATTARRFDRAYCQQAVCGPSRTAVLTGRLPEHTGVWHNRNRFRDLYPDLQTPRGTRSSLRTSRTRPTLTDVSPTSLRRHLKSLAGSPRHSFLPLVSSSRTCRSTLRNFGGTSTAAATLLRRYGQPVRAPWCSGNCLC